MSSVKKILFFNKSKPVTEFFTLFSRMEIVRSCTFTPILGMKMMSLSGLIAFFWCCAACNNIDENSRSNTPAVAPGGTVAAPAMMQANVLNVLPHDTSAYTQGFLVYNGNLLEGTGGKDGYPYNTKLIKTDLATGMPVQVKALDRDFFGEGITVFKDTLYQISWTERKGFKYDPATFKKLGEFGIRTEGWGLTHDSTNLILSDGSSNLYFLNPATFTTERIVSVTDQYGPTNNLNELEFINGYVYANKYQSNLILKIDPSNGQVVAKADLTDLLNANKNKYFPNTDFNNGDAVLNGIAYNPATNKFYITGKLWPVIFELQFN